MHPQRCHHYSFKLVPSSLEITDATLQGLSLLYLDDDEVVAFLLELLPRGILVEEGIADFLKTLERA